MGQNAPLSCSPIQHRSGEQESVGPLPEVEPVPRIKTEHDILMKSEPESDHSIQIKQDSDSLEDGELMESLPSLAPLNPFRAQGQVCHSEW